MPVMGPSYNSNKANETAEILWKLLINDYKVLNLPEDFMLVNTEKRNELKKEFTLIIHKIYELDCWEGF